MAAPSLLPLPPSLLPLLPPPSHPEGEVRASPQECQGHWQQKDYKSFSPGTDWDNMDWSSAPAIQEMPVVSAICEPGPGAAVWAEDGKVTGGWRGGGR